MATYDLKRIENCSHAQDAFESRSTLRGPKLLKFRELRAWSGYAKYLFLIVLLLQLYSNNTE